MQATEAEPERTDAPVRMTCTLTRETHCLALTLMRVLDLDFSGLVRVSLRESARAADVPTAPTR